MAVGHMQGCRSGAIGEVQRGNAVGARGRAMCVLCWAGCGAAAGAAIRRCTRSGPAQELPPLQAHKAAQYLEALSWQLLHTYRAGSGFCCWRAARAAPTAPVSTPSQQLTDRKQQQQAQIKQHTSGASGSACSVLSITHQLIVHFSAIFTPQRGPYQGHPCGLAILHWRPGARLDVRSGRRRPAPPHHQSGCRQHQCARNCRTHRAARDRAGAHRS